MWAVDKCLGGRNHSILSYVAYLGLIRFLYLTLNIVRITAVVYNTLLENLQKWLWQSLKERKTKRLNAIVSFLQ